MLPKADVVFQTKLERSEQEKKGMVNVDKIMLPKADVAFQTGKIWTRYERNGKCGPRMSRTRERNETVKKGHFTETSINFAWRLLLGIMWKEV